jgi:hypothetical protein
MSEILFWRRDFITFGRGWPGFAHGRDSLDGYPYVILFVN